MHWVPATEWFPMQPGLHLQWTYSDALRGRSSYDLACHRDDVDDDSFLLVCSDCLTNFFFLCLHPRFPVFAPLFLYRSLLASFVFGCGCCGSPHSIFGHFPLGDVGVGSIEPVPPGVRRNARIDRPARGKTVVEPYRNHCARSQWRCIDWRR